MISEIKRREFNDKILARVIKRLFSWNFLEEQPIKKMLPKKFMHHHNDHDYATMQSTETN